MSTKHTHAQVWGGFTLIELLVVIVVFVVVAWQAAGYHRRHEFAT
jgi:prepilin-type N-terminal cleavage/methylation domain-containing protein